VVLASRLLGRPVRWIEDRRENLVAASHARSDRMTCSMALDADGRILGVRLDHVDDCGALPVGGGGGSGTATVTRFTGPYRMPHVAYRTTSVWTNTCARGAYRGPWMMETTAREQMMDTVARELGIDPVELRRRNALRPDDLPYPSPTGPVVDGVSVVETLEAATAAIDYEGFRAEQARARDEGRHLGIGVSLFVEPQGSVARLRVETATARLASDGSVTVHVGSGAHGQGIATTMAQVVADELGVAVDAVRVLQGDTDSAPFGNGTGGSRTGPFLSAAVRGASVGLRERILRVASDVLEASADDLSLVDGGVAVRGTPSRSLTLAEIAFEAMSRPSAVGGPVDAALEATFRYEAPGVTWSNACHVATCEVDGETGEVRLLRYVVAEDCGQLINPKIVDGQVAGGVTQGIGGALLEHVVYDDDGNPLSTSYLDYLVPVASGLPRIEIVHVSTSDTPKGMGEGGAIGAPACVTNAVADALAPLGAPRPRPPLSPSTVLAAIHGW
jgi:carbon-monoxide dehydrogenase large subunit